MNQQADEDIPDIADIHLAQARIRARVRLTPVINDSRLDEVLGCRLYCKCENLQRTGAFKFRGASNAIARLREDGRDGDVATHSSGNHGAALALAARLDGRTAHVVMPENSSRLKIAAVRGYGGQIHFCAPSNEARGAKLQELVAAGMIPIHPFDNADIIAGQGTAALELQQAVPVLEQVITPIAGGGLISGTAIATRPWGVAIKFGGLQAFVPASQIADPPRNMAEDDRARRLTSLVGRRMGFKVVEVNMARRRLVLSQRPLCFGEGRLRACARRGSRHQRKDS